MFRGLLNYLIMNAILSIGSITGLSMSNSLLLIISCYGKVGYYPFFSVLLVDKDIFIGSLIYYFLILYLLFIELM